MKKAGYLRQKSAYDSLKRLFLAALAQVPWLCCAFGGFWYIHRQAPVWLQTYFDLTLHKKLSAQLQNRLSSVEENLSLLNPLHYADYISALSSTTVEKAKISVIEQTIDLLLNCLDAALFGIGFLLCIIALFRWMGCWRRKTSENDIANAVMEKLLPLLQENGIIQNTHKD